MRVLIEQSLVKDRQVLVLRRRHDGVEEKRFKGRVEKFNRPYKSCLEAVTIVRVRVR
jgi:hypothetical protein